MPSTAKGPAGTQETVRLVKEAAARHGVRNIVVASNSGETALLFADMAKAGFRVVCVGHAFGFAGPGQNEMKPEARQALAEAGIALIHAAHVLSGAERGISKQFGGRGPVEIMASTLYLFGQGTKVCVEIAAMALDAGLVPYGEDLLAVAGTGRGADTACIIRPAYTADILATRVREIVCKPWDC